MSRSFLAIALCATALSVGAMTVSAPAFARGGNLAEAHQRALGTPHATASVSGTQEKTLLHKQNSGHYSVCNHGSHALALNYDENNASVDSGDCMAVEAKKISVKGTDNAAFNQAFVYNHSHLHNHHGHR